MSNERTKAMEEALQAAVSRMNKSDGGASGMAADPIGMLMTLLPKLLENNDEREDLVEKLDGLEKETFHELKEQLRGLRKQVHRLFKAQQEALEELRDLREQQTAVGQAVLHLAEQMSRLDIVDDIGDEPEEEDFEDEDLLDDPDVYQDLSSAIAADRGRPKTTTTQRRKRQRPRRRN